MTSSQDNLGDACDCATADGTLWSLPSAVTDLTLTGGASTDLAWSPPVDPGGTAVPLYDVVRSTTSDFSAVSCVETDIPGTTASDADIPGLVYRYLVRVKNGCGDNTGLDAAGDARVTPACP